MKHFFLSLVLFCVLSCQTFAGSVYFRVAEFPGQEVHNDSFIISIDEQDTNRLAHARALADWIAGGGVPENSPGATIVLANMEAGSDGVNRNVNADGEPAWSWHTTEPVDFVDFTIEILDGWPTFVEQDVDSWIANTNGNIGFWSYTVVEELAVPEPSILAFIIPVFVVLSAIRQRRTTSFLP